MEFTQRLWTAELWMKSPMVKLSARLSDLPQHPISSSLACVCVCVCMCVCVYNFYNRSKMSAHPESLLWDHWISELVKRIGIPACLLSSSQTAGWAKVTPGFNWDSGTGRGPQLPSQWDMGKLGRQQHASRLSPSTCSSVQLNLKSPSTFSKFVWCAVKHTDRTIHALACINHACPCRRAMQHTQALSKYSLFVYSFGASYLGCAALTGVSISLHTSPWLLDYPALLW